MTLKHLAKNTKKKTDIIPLAMNKKKIKVIDLSLKSQPKVAEKKGKHPQLKNRGLHSSVNEQTKISTRAPKPDAISSASLRKNQLDKAELAGTSQEKKFPHAKIGNGKLAQRKEALDTLSQDQQRKDGTPNATKLLSTLYSNPAPAVLQSFREATLRNQVEGNLQGRSRQRARQGKRKIEEKGFLAKPPKEGKRYTFDLRIHSPGTMGYFSTGGVEAGSAIIRLARVKGIHIIGLTDYYNASYVDEVQNVAAQSRVILIPGLDFKCVIGSCRQAYTTALFPERIQAKDLFQVLNELKVPESAYGRRDYCIEVSFSQVVEIVEAHGGVIIPSRLDKTPYRQLAIPTLVEEFGFHAFDLVHPDHLEFFRERWPNGEFTFLSFSNANALAQIGSRIVKAKLVSPGFAGIKKLVERRR